MAAGLRVRYHCQKKRKKRSGREETNEMSSPSSSRAAAVRKIVFETWSHQDYFGAVGDSFPSAATAAEEAHHFAPRVFCDVSINRKKRDAGSSSVRWWKKRRWWGQCGGGGVTDNTHKNDDDDDDDGGKNNNNEKNSDSRHGKLVSYKPFVLETGETPRCYYPRYHINVWRWDDDDDDDDNNTIRMNTTMPSNDHNYNFPTPREFLRQLEVGDTIGVWGRVGKGETYHIIDAMRMHVFWAL